MNYLAFDIGGTNTKYAVVTECGTFVKKDIIPTPSQYKDLLLLIQNIFLKEKTAPSIGLSCPGIYDPGKKQLTGSSALSYLIGKNIVGDLQDLLNGVEVYIDNDGNCALLGEYWQGHAKGLKDAAIIVVGSAVGGAAMINGKLLRGSNLNGGEFGYMLIDNDLNKMSFRSFGGKSGLNGLLDFARENGYAVKDGLDLFEQIKSNEVLAELIQNRLLYTAIGIINLQYLLDPAVIIIGGAISKNEMYIQMLEKSINTVMATRENYKIRPKILPAKHANDANLLGAVYLVLGKGLEESKTDR